MEMMKKMKLIKKMGVQEAESSPSRQSKQQVLSFFEWENGQQSWKTDGLLSQRTDDQQLKLVSMSPLVFFLPAPLNEPSVPQNLPDEQPRRMTDPLAQSVHQTSKTVKLDKRIRG